MTAMELVQRIMADHPTVRLAIGGERGDTALATWDGEGWRMGLGQLLNGAWARIGNLFVDGKPVVTNWREV